MRTFSQPLDFIFSFHFNCQIFPVLLMNSNIISIGNRVGSLSMFWEPGFSVKFTAKSSVQKQETFNM